MNKIRLESTHHRCLAVIAAAMFLLLGTSLAQGNLLTGRALSPQEIHDNNLDAKASGGLLAVGVGEPAYLELLMDKKIQVQTNPSVYEDLVITGVSWSLLSQPAGSNAFIELSPIPMSMSAYSPREQAAYQVADRMMLVPDVKGAYIVEAAVSTDHGLFVLSAQVTGANYTGVGLVNDPNHMGPEWPQCALCHPQKAADYMETGHATFFEEAIDGIKSSHYNSDCIKCHTVGGHVPEADNGNFASVAASVGWTFPEVLEPGNWAAMPLELKEKSNIQCEHCHGAGSEHIGRKDYISVSLSAGDCAQCHDEAPYHNRSRQWLVSGHSRPPRRTGSCGNCHTGDGFINRMDGQQTIEPVGESLVCAACHDPHSTEGGGGHGGHQLRSVADVTLENGHIVTAGGHGKFCMNCHKARRNAEPYALSPDPDNSNGPGKTSSHFGPHYGVQGDLFNGTNVFTYGKVAPGASPHLYALEDSCVSCHMQSIDRNDPAFNKAGDHTWKMVFDNDTPDDHSDDVAMGGICADCHGPIDSFDIPKYDYNYDGVVEGIQTEVHHLLEALALKLHPVGSPEVKLGDSSHYYTDAEKKALYNYMAVEEDNSFGLHNPRFITGILRASIDDLGDPLNSVLNGVNIPVGGPWYYSPWFDFYSPATDGWIYHATHGYLNVAGDAENLLIYDPVLDKWLYTNANLYPILVDVADGTWIQFQGRYGNYRYFYNYNTGKWDVVE